MTSLDTAAFPGLPCDEAGPVFGAPWQAQAFALVVKLQRDGVISPGEWAAELGAAIEAARAAGDPDLGDTYYLHWLAALERLALRKGLATADLLATRKAEAFAAWRALHVHDHDDHDGHGHAH